MKNQILLIKIISISLIVVASSAFFVNNIQAELPKLAFSRILTFSFVNYSQGERATITKDSTVIMEWDTLDENREVNNNVPIVDIYLITGELKTEIARNIENTGSYDWLVSGTGTDKIIRICGEVDETEYCSDSPLFNIVVNTDPKIRIFGRENGSILAMESDLVLEGDFIPITITAQGSWYSWDYMDWATYQVDIDLYREGVFMAKLADGITVTENETFGTGATRTMKASHRMIIPMDYEVGRGYSLRISDSKNPLIYHQIDDLHLRSMTVDGIRPGELTDIVISKETSTGPAYRVKFEYTAPDEIDYYCVNFIQSSIGPDSFNYNLSECLNKNTLPGVRTSFVYEDQYIKEHSSGTVYYAFGSEDTSQGWQGRAQQTHIYSYSWDDSGNISTEVYENSSTKIELSDIKDGDLIRYPKAIGNAQFDIYIAKIAGDKKFKRLILSPYVLESYGHFDKNGNGTPWDDVIDVGPTIMTNLITSDLVREVNEPRVFRLTVKDGEDVGKREWLNLTSEEFNVGYDNESVYEINNIDFSKYSEGENINKLRQVMIYLNTDSGAVGGDCISNNPVIRSIPETSSVPLEALWQLMKDGGFEIFNIRLLDLKINNGIALVYFNEELGYGPVEGYIRMPSSCIGTNKVTAIRNTLLQFDEINEIRLFIEEEEIDISSFID